MWLWVDERVACGIARVGAWIWHGGGQGSVPFAYSRRFRGSALLTDQPAASRRRTSRACYFPGIRPRRADKGSAPVASRSAYSKGWSGNSLKGLSRPLRGKETVGDPQYSHCFAASRLTSGPPKAFNGDCPARTWPPLRCVERPADPCISAADESTLCTLGDNGLQQ